MRDDTYCRAGGCPRSDTLPIMNADDKARNATGAISPTVEQLYRTYYRPLLHHLERIVGDREAAQDLFQDTFVKVLRHWDRHSELVDVRSWLYRIATNTAYDYLRWRRRQALVPLNPDILTSALDDGLDAWVEEATVRTALSDLPAHYRKPLQLALAGYHHNVIAAEIGCKTVTVRSRLYRARARFREVYAA
jgi:RNA polymerase sigma-70 factor (ECF subfamily)